MSAVDVGARAGLTVLRKIKGPGSDVELKLRRRIRWVREQRMTKHREGDVDVWVGHKGVVLRHRDEPEPRAGIFLRGACDLPALFLAVADLKRRARGTTAIYLDGIGIADSRADVLLQSLETVSPEARADLANLGISEAYVEPVVFQPQFTVPGAKRLGPFPKSVTCLSIGPNIVRTTYESRQHGLIVDPGGFWLNESLDMVLTNRDRAMWFAKNYKRLGRMTVEQFHRDFGAVARQIRARTGGHLLVFNMLGIDKADPTFDYEHVKNPPALRRREFSVALYDLARQIDFHIVDADRALKGAGISDMVDFVHYGPPLQAVIAREAMRILDELGVFD